MFFKANAALPSQEAYISRTRELGIEYNGYTTDEAVIYYFTLPSRNLDAGMKFMADAITSPLFDSTELIREREVVLGEFDRNEAGPLFTLRYAVDSAMWMPYVARKQPLGQRPVIKSATPLQMQTIQKRFYIPNNSALIVSGDVKPDKVFNIATSYFSAWASGSAPFPTYTPPSFPPLKPQLIVREARVPDVSIQMVFRGPSIGQNDRDVHVAQYLMTLLRQPTSRFYSHLVDSGLVTGLGADYTNAMNVGPITFSIGAPREKARRAYEVLKQELREAARPGYFTAEDLDAGKQIIANRRLFEQDNSGSFGIYVAPSWWSRASLDYYNEFSSVVSTITEADIVSFVNTYIVNKPFVLGIGADRKTLDALNFTQEALQW
jgi:zinc protease